MPSTNSAKKSLRQNKKRHLHNHAVKGGLRTQIRKVRTAVAAGDLEAGKAEFIVAQKKIDKAAARKIIHANAAARTKSRLSAAIKNLESGAN